jgi:hypothetical protein
VFQDDPDPDEQVARYLEEHGERLRNAAVAAAEDLASIGVHLDAVTWFLNAEVGEVNVAFHGVLHELAFEDRPPPDQHVVDEEFEGIAELLIDEDYERAWWELRDDE